MAQETFFEFLVDIFQIIGSLATAGALIYSIQTFAKSRKSDEVKAFTESIMAFASAHPGTSISWVTEDGRGSRQLEYKNYLNKGEVLALLRKTGEIKNKTLIREIDSQIVAVYDYFVNTVPLFSKEEFEVYFPHMTAVYTDNQPGKIKAPSATPPSPSA